MSQHRCEWPSGCPTKNGVRLVEFTNAFGETVRHWFCKGHLAVMRDHPERMQELRGNLYRAWDATAAAVTPEQLHRHPAHLALVDHQRLCERCGAVRDWIAGEEMAGRITTAADVNRIGAYVIENGCPEGVRLNFQVGLVMRGLHR